MPVETELCSFMLFLEFN